MSSLVVSLLLSCPLCLLFSWSRRALGASWKPLRRLWWTYWGLWEADFGPLDGPWACPAPWGALGGSWAAPGALLAPPGRLLELPGRLQSRSLPKNKNSLTVYHFSMFFGPPGALLAPPEALLGLSWRPKWALGWLLARNLVNTRRETSGGPGGRQEAPEGASRGRRER